MQIKPLSIEPKLLSDFDPAIFTESVSITGVCINAQRVEPGDLFIACPGQNFHGKDFISQAIANGAVAVLSDVKIDCSIPSFTHKQPRALVGELSSWVYEKPFEKLSAVGITGTNGKTTTANLVSQILNLNSSKCGLIGTLGIEINDHVVKGSRTTPEADELQAIARAMVEQGCSHLSMEVSSHAIVQNRIKGASFKLVAFSNLTQDHLDYHKTMQAYFEAKAALFTSEYAQKAVINIDDAYGEKLLNQTQLPVISVSRKKSSADWYFEKAELRNNSYDVEIKGIGGEVVKGNFPLIGDYNLDNLILAVAITHQLGISSEQISNTLSRLKSVPGRLETVNAGQSFIGLVDYAHTPDAVQNVIATARKLTSGKVIGVLGCGGDRDNSKRPLMGQALFQGCDVSIFTSDNPRSESADSILKEMISGLDLGQKGEVCIDRREAISLAVNKANAGDVVLIMGKGHESGQEIKGVITPFDDRLELTQAILKQGSK